MGERKRIENILLDGVKRFEARLTYLRSKSRKLSWYRLALFFSALILFLFFFFNGNSLPMYVTLVLFFILFGILTGIHNKLELGIRKNILWSKIKKIHIARMNLKWDELPPSLFSPDKNHPFDFDLGITGEYSIHRLINTAESFEGSLVLKEWFTSLNPDFETINNRQLLVRELINLSRFRDKLSLNSVLVNRKGLKGTKILEWINSPSEYNGIKKILNILSMIIPVNIILFVLFLLEIIPAHFAFSLLIYAALHWFYGRYISGIFEKLLTIGDEFGKFTIVFDFLEKYPYRSGSRLKEFCSVFLLNMPSKEFAKINNILNAVSITKNPFAALILNAIFPYNFFLALRLEKIKGTVRNEMPVWLDVWHNLEAYNSLANYAFLNPHCSFPVIKKDDFTFTGKNIQHPLIYPGNNISNDFFIKKRGEVFIITGSNMSGKSTFLKTTGTNLALAYAGGVVNAEHLETSLFRIFCCINISDSVIDGISYFYAEVKRLKKLLLELEDSAKYPVLYLIDEIFRGTNNIERLKGSRSYIKLAAGLNGAGLVATHDLELSKLADEIPQVKNFHFREEAMEGRMIFDYRIHQGPSPTTNALKIMKSEGLPVE